MAKCNQQERRPSESLENCCEIIGIEKTPFVDCMFFSMETINAN